MVSREYINQHLDDGKYKQIHDLQRHYTDNSVHTTKYTILSFIPKNLFEQFHRFANVYFVFIVLLNFVPAISAIQPFLSMVPVIGILLVQAIKDVIEDYGRYTSDKEVNFAICRIYKRCSFWIVCIWFKCVSGYSLVSNGRIVSLRRTCI